MSTINAVPMNMVFQEPKCVMSMGMFQDAGFTEVPVAIFISDMAAGLISTMGMFMPRMLGSWAARVASDIANRISFTEDLFEPGCLSACRRMAVRAGAKCRGTGQGPVLQEDQIRRMVGGGTVRPGGDGS